MYSSLILTNNTELTAVLILGKTFLLNVLLDTCRLSGKPAQAVAISGIAALALHGGRTAHSTFAIPVHGLTDESTCAMGAQTYLAKRAREADLLVWDEISMPSKNQIDAVDKSLRVRE